MINMYYGSLDESINLGKTIEKVKKIVNKNKDKKDKIKKDFEDQQNDIDDTMSSIKGIRFSDDGNVAGKYYVANTSEITKNLKKIEDPKQFMLYYFIKDEITPYVNNPGSLTEDKGESIYNKVKAKRDNLRDEINNLIKSKGEIKKYLSTKSFSGTSLDVSKKIKEANEDMKKLLNIIELIDKKYQSCFKEDDNFWGSMFKLANFTTKGINEDAWYLILEIEELEMEYYYNYTAVYSMLVNTYYKGISDAIEKNINILDRISEGPTNESTEALDEFFSTKKSKSSKAPKIEPKKSYTYTKEELDEIKSIKNQIKKIAPGIIKKYNNNKEALSTLSDSIDLLDDDKLKAKFEFAINDETNHSIYIWVFGKEVGDRITYLYDSKEDFDYHFDKWTHNIIYDIANGIKEKLPDTKLVKMTVDPESLAGEIMFEFYPR